MVLKGCFYVAASLCSLVESINFGVNFFMDACHIFLSVLAITPSIRDVTGVVSRACTGYLAGSPLCSTAVTALLGSMVCSSGVGVEAMKTRFDKAPLPLSVCCVPKEVRGETSEDHVVRATYPLPGQACVQFCPEAAQCCIPFFIGDQGVVAAGTSW